MPERSAYRGWDRFFVAAFGLFSLVAFVHEPLFYLYCGWDGLRHDSCSNATVAAIWKGYARLDPVYFDMPLWMALMIGFDSVLLSPFYLYSIYVFATGRADTPLYRAIGYSVSGALVYAMVLYLSWESLTARQYGAALGAVVAYNIPWGLVPLLLVVRLYRGSRT
ncbi:MAG: hypothetical protein P4L83_11720 [Nevskia sp.]|nr:hypothetical protein [Nevskia sp.]